METRPRRAISSKHTSSGKGDLYLRYGEADFKGKVQMKAQSYTAIGLQNDGVPVPDQDGYVHSWHGDVNGGDNLAISSNGWVGLYF